VRKTYVPDPLGSTVALLDNTQAQTDTFNYWPYGEEEARTGTTPSPFRFVGVEGYRQQSATLSYIRARTFRQAVGRWITADPLRDAMTGSSTYAYVMDRPVTFSDRTGLSGPYHPPEGVRTRCDQNDYCEDLQGKIWLLLRMISSHEGWDRHVPPPRGGGRHAGEIAEFYRALARCQNLQGTCRPRPQPQPCRRAVLEPAKPPWDQNVPWELIGEIGKGLILVGGGGLIIIGAPHLLPILLPLIPKFPEIPRLIPRFAQ